MKLINIGRVASDSAAENIKAAATSIADENHPLYPAKERLNILLSGASKDVFAAEIRYHFSCYIDFIIRVKDTERDEPVDNNKEMHQLALNDFFVKIHRNIVRERNAYLLNEPLDDWLSFCEDVLHLLFFVFAPPSTINEGLPPPSTINEGLPPPPLP